MNLNKKESLSFKRVIVGIFLFIVCSVVYYSKTTIVVNPFMAMVAILLLQHGLAVVWQKIEDGKKG
jgi:hypothetical protein